MDEAPTTIRPDTSPAPVHDHRGHRRRYVVLSIVAAAVLVLVAGVAWFQPYKLWIDKSVTEAVPAGAVPIAQGTFVSHEHRTVGNARLLRLADGSLVLRLDQLDTSNGPRLEVWLSDQPVRTGKAGWHVFADGRHVGLGPLLGNRGSQNYPVPPGLDVTRYGSVTIWCARFHVSFGAASLTPTG